MCLKDGRLIRYLTARRCPLRERYRAAVARRPSAHDVGVLRAAWLIARKDLRVEARSRELLYTTLFFALACVLVFAFAFVPAKGRPIEGAAAGILWVAITFSGTLALGRTFERERQGETLRALLLSPSSGRRCTSASSSAC